MAFVKLDTGILNSTLWIDRDSREVFITALLMAIPRQFSEPIAQIEVESLTPTGWEAPAGWYGYVEAAGVGIIGRAMIDKAAGLAALARLGSPENDSRSPAFEGRRMIRMDGGYVILNYDHYRQKDHTAAKRQRDLRARKKISTVTRDVDTVTRDDSDKHGSNGVTSRNITHAEAYAYPYQDPERARPLPVDNFDAMRSRTSESGVSPNGGSQKSNKELARALYRRHRASLSTGERAQRSARVQQAFDATGGAPTHRLRTEFNAASLEAAWIDAYLAGES